MISARDLGFEIQFVNADRDPPRSRPAITKPGTAAANGKCQECGANSKRGAVLRHVQRIRTPEGKPFLEIITDVPLCPHCAAADRKRGWPALARTWRYMAADAAREFIENALQKPVGGVQ